MTARIAVAALARPTFDVPFARAVADDAFASLERLGFEIIGARQLLFDAEAARGALEAFAGRSFDLLLLLQVTFTDATMTVRLAQAVDAPLLIWSFPEPRTGGRLRLNALCGLNLAAHALGRAGRAAHYLHASARAPELGERIGEASRRGDRRPAPEPRRYPAGDRGAAASRRVAGTKLGLVGRHPEGFDTCRFDPEQIRARLGIEVEGVELAGLFAAAARCPEPRIERLARRAGRELAGIDAVDRNETRKSLTLYASLRDLAAERGLSSLAVRCWPEMFTEYGCAVCRPMGMLTDDGVPAACEADVLGAVTSLLLQELQGKPAWLVDLVDLDQVSDTGVIWHCGLAPLAMRDPSVPARADIHSNRKMPLLAAFPLRPGRVTLARLSQARNELQLVVAGAEAIAAPPSFSGTSGVIRFDRPVAEVLENITSIGLEHHLSVVYGDCRAGLEEVAGALDILLTRLA